MKKSVLTLLLLGCLVQLAYTQAKPSPKYKDIKLDSSYDHLKWGVEPSDLVFNFAAYTTSFDSSDLNPCLNTSPKNCDKTEDRWATPEWVAYEIKKLDPSTVKPDYKRPSPWLTDDALYAQQIAPNDATYASEGTTKLKEVSGNFRYVRGHMCPKDAADRISMEAGFNTHTVLNAVPQLQAQNNGIWKKLELMCTEWANVYESVWVVCGPVFYNKNPSAWLGQYGEVKAAIPDAIFKIVIREDDTSPTGLTSLAFVIPNVIADDLNKEQELKKFLTTIEDVQDKTGLEFLTQLNYAHRAEELSRHSNLVEMRKQMSSAERNRAGNAPDSIANAEILAWKRQKTVWNTSN